MTVSAPSAPSAPVLGSNPGAGFGTSPTESANAPSAPSTPALGSQPGARSSASWPEPPTPPRHVAAASTLAEAPDAARMPPTAQRAARRRIGWPLWLVALLLAFAVLLAGARRFWLARSGNDRERDDATASRRVSEREDKATSQRQSGGKRAQGPRRPAPTADEPAPSDATLGPLPPEWPRGTDDARLSADHQADARQWLSQGRTALAAGELELARRAAAAILKLLEHRGHRLGEHDSPLAAHAHALEGDTHVEDLIRTLEPSAGEAFSRSYGVAEVWDRSGSGCVFVARLRGLRRLALARGDDDAAEGAAIWRSVVEHYNLVVAKGKNGEPFPPRCRAALEALVGEARRKASLPASP